jgi:hypothetical protein
MPTHRKETPYWGSICLIFLKKMMIAQRIGIAQEPTHGAMLPTILGIPFPEHFRPSHSPAAPPLRGLPSPSRPPEIIHPPAPASYRWPMPSFIRPRARAWNTEACLQMMKRSPPGTAWWRMHVDAYHKELVDALKVSHIVFFIPHLSLPKGKRVTHGRFVVDTWPNKEEAHHVRLTMGGGKSI